MPSTALDVEGSARTLICVDVIPSTGVCVAVGCAGSGVAVCDGTGIWVAGNVKVATRAAGVDIISSLRLELQPVYRRIKTLKITLENRMDTGKL
jgi:hypothetical protein